jgi:hypothetical protein
MYAPTWRTIRWSMSARWAASSSSLARSATQRRYPRSISSSSIAPVDHALLSVGESGSDLPK